MVQRDEPGQSSQQHLGRTGWGRQSFARDAAAGRERSEEILAEDKRVDYQEILKNIIYIEGCLKVFLWINVM